MQNETKQIMSSIQSMERGTVFFPSDFAYLAINSKLVLKVLERATRAQIILRLAMGIYCYPKVEEKYGLGVLYPSYEEIAQRIAQRDNIKIVPTGAYAQNLLGLTTQVPMNVVFLTDGRTKTIKLFNGHTIRFSHAAQKNFAFKCKTLMLLTFALKDMGQDGITDEQTQRVRSLLVNIPLEQLKLDLHLMPDWIRNYILKFYE